MSYKCDGCKHPENGDVIAHGVSPEGELCVNNIWECDKCGAQWKTRPFGDCYQCKERRGFKNNHFLS